jgi:hypothetical protein
VAGRPSPPKSLGAPGRALWEAILGDLAPELEFDARELHALTTACRIEDELAVMVSAIDSSGPVVTGSRGQPRPNPLLEEARLSRLAQSRLLAALQLDAPAVESPAQARARKAARTRWSTVTNQGERRKAG